MYVLMIVVCAFVLFLLAIVLSVLLRYTDSDCHFNIFKLFLLFTENDQLLV
jgi:preprotein translocase subunit SecG